MELQKKHIIGIVAAVIIIATSLLLLRGEKIFFFIMGIGVVIGVFPFIFSLMTESRKEKENNEMFLEFARNLAESVKAGTPISKSIINVRTKYYGTLTPYIQKLANQISLGISVKESLNTFAGDVNSPSVTRAIMLISEAEKAGGKIEDILDSVAKSVSEIEKLKKERRSAIYNLVVQGYIIFFIFIVIMLVMEFKILPMAVDFGGVTPGDASEFADLGFFGGGGGAGFTPEELSQPFLYLLLAQGFFTGLVIGKLAEGRVKQGLKHSFIMMIVAFLVTTGARALLGS
jgi:flagellar protein FlaJ